MNLKTYQGATMAEALARVKRDLGRDAVILQTRTVRRGGLFGLGTREVIEITASAEVNVMPRRPARQPDVATQAAKDNLARMFQAGGTTRQPAPAGKQSATTAPAAPPADAAMRQELTSIREMVEDLVRQTRSARMGDLPEELFNAYLQLIEGEVADEAARQLVESLRDRLTGEQASDRRLVRDALVQCVSRMIPTAEPADLAQPGPTRVIALVGPTGVGKTTTVAKLAANYKLRQHRRVGLVTIDTYRIAAVNQLATYAQIIDVPLKVVLSPAEMTATLAELAPHCDVILIDTAGRSPSDAMKLNELRQFLAAAQPDETHLVVSSTAGPAATRSAIERFSPLGVNRVILTKLDEAVSFGIILQVVRQVNASLSYVTTGQDVPDDIEVGSATRLARWIVNRSMTEQSSPPAGPPSGQLDVVLSGGESSPGNGALVAV